MRSQLGRVCRRLAKPSTSWQVGTEDGRAAVGLAVHVRLDCTYGQVGMVQEGWASRGSPMALPTYLELPEMIAGMSGDHDVA
jgi:hypothetical protein